MARRSTIFAASALACALTVGVAAPGFAGPSDSDGVESPFARTATYPVYQNVPAGVDPSAATVAEISTVSKDGKTQIYTDALGKRIGFVDISDPSAPKGLGTVSLAELGHADDQPTSVAVSGNYVLVVIDETGGDFTHPKGRVDVLRVDTHEKVASIDLLGQPDSIAINKDGSIAAIAIENQRDEELKATKGGLPQLPGGFVQTLNLKGDPSTWTAKPVYFNDAQGNPLPIVAAAGLDTPQDLEPEYVSINGKNQLAVTLQENNGVAIIDLNTNTISNVWSTGSVTLSGIDAKKDGDIQPTDTLKNVVREPDAVAWIGNDHLATANEGDWKGGSRGWTVWDTKGNVTWDAGSSIEELANKYGLHNEARAAKKGPEIEGIAVAEFNGTPYAFVGSERSNFVAVYNVKDPANPKFEQLLFTTNGPEGILPIPGRNLLAVSSETDDSSVSVRSAISLYQFGGAKPAQAQPSIVSVKDSSGHYVPWTALSTLTGDKKSANILYSASDSALKTAYIYTIDTAAAPAQITKRTAVTRDGKVAEGVDIEGLSARADGGFWIASEGKTGADNRIFRTDANGGIVEEIALPTDVSAHIGKWGFEGIDARTNAKGEEELFVAIQRPLWQDPTAKSLVPLEGNATRVGRYNTVTKQWTWFTFDLDETTTKGDWMGVSEITVLPNNTLALIERDKLNGPKAAVKRVVQVAIPSDDDIAKAGTTPVKLTKLATLDVLPKLRATNGWTQEKLEGFTIAKDGQLYAVTDNDGLADATGETVFLRLGDVRDSFKVGEPAPVKTSTPVASPSASVSPTAAPTASATATAVVAPSSAPSAAATAKATATAAASVTAAPKAAPATARASKHGALPRTGVDGGAYVAVASAALAMLVAGGSLVLRGARRR